MLVHAFVSGSSKFSLLHFLSAVKGHLYQLLRKNGEPQNNKCANESNTMTNDSISNICQMTIAHIRKLNSALSNFKNGTSPEPAKIAEMCITVLESPVVNCYYGDHATWTLLNDTTSKTRNTLQIVLCLHPPNIFNILRKKYFSHTLLYV